MHAQRPNREKKVGQFGHLAEIIKRYSQFEVFFLSLRDPRRVSNYVKETLSKRQTIRKCGSVTCMKVWKCWDMPGETSIAV